MYFLLVLQGQGLPKTCDETCRISPTLDLDQINKYKGQRIGEEYFALIIPKANPNALVVITEDQTPNHGDGTPHLFERDYKLGDELHQLNVMDLPKGGWYKAMKDGEARGIIGLHHPLAGDERPRKRQRIFTE
jgi:hypothetical protein